MCRLLTKAPTQERARRPLEVTGQRECTTDSHSGWFAWGMVAAGKQPKAK